MVPAKLEEQNPACEPRQRRATQRRAEETRAALLETAIEQFSSVGYDGVSARTLESSAGVQRGAVAYHFGGKEELWKSAIDLLLSRFEKQFEPLEPTIRDLDLAGRVRAAVTAFIRFSAETPAMSRLMVQEGRQPSWRLSYIVENGVQPRREWFEDVVGVEFDMHTYYIVLGASTFVFDVEHECRLLFDADPTSDEFIRTHAARIADLLLQGGAGTIQPED